MSRLADLLTKTSRTFAISIRLLPEPLRQEITIAYLLLRVADTFEDADLWTPEQRVKALARLDVLIGACGGATAEHDSARWAAALPCEHEGYLELLEELPSLLDALAKLEPTAKATIIRHVRRTISGMIKFLTARGTPGNLVIADLAELRRYCYVVAGIVGELLTELFVEQGHVPRSQAVVLWEKAAAFGEALQLVNILKDADEDARQGRSLLPDGIDREALFQLAHDDLDIADEYVRTLRKSGVSWGVVGFTMLPVRLARATLHRVAKDGPGAKLSRSEVREHIAELEHASLG
jgi:farnesyl-diphosphate farnesyltransferase